MSNLRVHPYAHMQGAFRVPGDKSVSHRAAIFAGISDGVCLISNFLPSEDCLCTLSIMEQLGAKVEVLNDQKETPTELRITGTSLSLKSPSGDLDCGNSGTAMRLLAGLLAGQGGEGFQARLIGDESLSSRPMKRIMKPLLEMGADIISEGDQDGCAPLRVKGKEYLSAITYEMPIASAQVKSAILLAALTVPEQTTVIQSAPTRDHTERLLNEMGIQVTTSEHGGKQMIALCGGQAPQAKNLLVPGDISSAAFWLVAASAREGAELTIHDVGLNPTRVAVISFLQRMGADITILGERAKEQHGEPIGDIQIRGKKLKATALLAEEVPNLIDEIPILSLAAVLAEGRTTFRHAKELRVKETDRIHTVVQNWKELGVIVEEFNDGFEIQGGQTIYGGEVTSYGDHRIAMTFAIAGLFAQEAVLVKEVECIQTSYPGFQDHLAQFQPS